MSADCDVCVIGSGAAGGVAAYVLTAGGASVQLLEAGPPVVPALDFRQHDWPYDLALRGRGIGGEHDGMMAANGFWKIDGEPYLCATGSRFRWFRSRVVGGRTNHWGQGAFRFDPEDFRSETIDGVGDDWPISCQDLEPYYDKVELDIGVYASPRFPDLLPIPGPRCTELFMQRACQAIGLPCDVPPGSILTKHYRGRNACHFCGQCWRGCRDGANYSSSQVHIPAALATGRLALTTNAMAREILVGSDGTVTGVSYIDKLTGAEQRVRARVVVLAASACESARLLLNSRSRFFPNGLGNHSGVIGRHLRDSVTTYGTAYFPQLEGVRPHNHDGTGRPHLWVPKGKLANDATGAIKSFHVFFIGGRNMPSVSDFDFVLDRAGGYGHDLKRACRSSYGAVINFVAAGEMITNKSSYCTVSDSVTDEWGIPVLTFHFNWSDQEVALVRAMQATIRAIVDAAGGQIFAQDTPQGISSIAMGNGGEAFHEQGTVRMGSDRNTSALNQMCQLHDVENVFVVDAASFVSSSAKPPTLTIMALSWRAAEYLLDRLRAAEL